MQTCGDKKSVNLALSSVSTHRPNLLIVVGDVLIPAPALLVPASPIVVVTTSVNARFSTSLTSGYVIRSLAISTVRPMMMKVTIGSSNTRITGARFNDLVIRDGKSEGSN